jgi:hypothetical protein
MYILQEFGAAAVYDTDLPTLNNKGNFSQYNYLLLQKQYFALPNATCFNPKDHAPRYN